MELSFKYVKKSIVLSLNSGGKVLLTIFAKISYLQFINIVIPFHNNLHQ